jgi:hypothetical protein
MDDQGDPPRLPRLLPRDPSRFPVGGGYCYSHSELIALLAEHSVDVGSSTRIPPARALVVADPATKAARATPGRLTDPSPDVRRVRIGLRGGH